MTLPKLGKWTPTAEGLHKGVLLLGAIQRLTQPPKPAYLELGLQLLPHGLAGDQLPEGGRVEFDFTSVNLSYVAANGAKVTIFLNARTQKQAFDDLFGLLADGELAGVFPDGDNLFERVSAAIADRGERYKPPKPETLIDETVIQIDKNTASDYIVVLNEIFTGIARFRARLGGMMSPLIVWPEHFDLSTLLFLGNELDDWQPHISIGFAPFSPGIPNPYLYAYAYPYPDSYDHPHMPQGARWHTEGWTGIVLPYEVIASKEDPARFVESSCQTIYEGLLPLASQAETNRSE